MSPQEMKQLKLTAIYEALMGQLVDHAFSEISIAALCRQAGVSRTYYYRNFNSFEEIITRAQNMMIRGYLRRVSRRAALDFSALMTTYFQYSREHAAQTLLLIEAGQTATLIKTFRAVFVFLAAQGLVDALKSTRGRSPYFAAYLAGAVVAIETQWLQSGIRETPEQMGALVQNFFGL